jgi:hypothetical protein
MRFLFGVLLLTACGGADLSSAQADDLAGSCGGLKSAHCFCKVVGGPVLTTGSPDSIIPIFIDGQELFTYRIPGKCYNQQADLLNSHFDAGCWRDCRDAFGVEGHPRDAAVTQLIADTSKTLRALGACGGWMSAPLEYAAGTNKPRDATAMGIGIGIGGTVVVVNGHKECR